jgi:PAP2 superfamily
MRRWGQILGFESTSVPARASLIRQRSTISQVVAALILLCLLSVSSSAGAQQGEVLPNPLPRGNEPSLSPGSLAPVTWQTEYRRFGWVDGALTGGGLTALIVSRTIGPGTSGPQGGVWFDDDVRDALRASSYSGRLLAADVSDVLLGLSVAYALFADPLINASWLRKSPDVGKQVFLLNAEVLALTLGLQQTVANTVGRERPYGQTCGTSDLSEDTEQCEGGDRYRSFFSGHTSVPFALAASTCTHHLYLPLSGSSKNAWIACASGFLVAGTTGVMRVVADYHYATDVLAGAFIGSAIGFGVPLLHYTTGVRLPAAQMGTVRLQLAPMGVGLQLYGVMK